MHRVGDIARLNVIAALGTTALGVAFLWAWGSRGLIAYVISVPLVTFIVGHIFVARLPKHREYQPTLPELTAEWKVLFQMGVAMLGVGLVGQLSQLWIRIDIVRVLGPQSLGQYQAAWTISMQYVAFVLAAMGTDYYPRLTGVIHDHEAATRLVNEQTEIATLLSAPVLIFVMALTPWLIHLLYARSFAPSASILRWQVLGDVLKIASWPLGYVIVAAGDGKAFFASETFGWLIATGTIAFLMPVWGLRMTGIAYILMYAFYLPLVFWLARRRIGFRWSRSVISLTLVVMIVCIAVSLLPTGSIWATCFGTAAAAAFAIFSLCRLACMSSIGGGQPTRLSAAFSAVPFLGNLLTDEGETIFLPERASPAEAQSLQNDDSRKAE
jgi:PST family polysaccharide transporter